MFKPDLLSLGRRQLRFGALVSTLILAGASSLVAAPHNYGEALQKGIFFFDCQRSGKLPADNRVSWRGDSAVNDGADNGKDLTGGWYDAGDHVKFNLPMAYSTTVLAWGVLENKAAYEASGQLPYMLSNLRWACDYFVKCHTAPNELWGQVGSNADHNFWGPAEVMQMARPSYKISAAKPGTDLAGETAAALAACSMVFKESDPAYSAKLLSHAKELYTFADTYRGKYSDAITEAQAFYNSWSGYKDELVWGAIWLYKATNDMALLNKAKTYYADLPYEGQSTTERSYKWTLCWDDKAYGCYLLMAQLTGEAQYMQDTERNLDWWTINDGKHGLYTPGGLAYVSDWASCRYAANIAFTAMVYGNWVTDPVKKKRYQDFALKQINYILGDNPLQMSFMIGYGKKWPQQVHHRTAHSSWTDNLTSPTLMRHTLFGALVGGTDTKDGFEDNRNSYRYTEVACDYNAAFVGTLAGMYKEYGGDPLPNFPVKEIPNDDELFVEASVNASGTNFTEIKSNTVNKSGWPARMGDKLSFKYFFTLEPGVTPSMITVGSSYANGATISGPIQWAGSTYYINVSFVGQKIYPGGQSAFHREVQFRMASTGAWDPRNDWSFAGVPTTPGTTPVKVVNIALYDNGVKIFGNEPPTGVVPATPAGVAATAGDTQVSLAWNASSGASSYNVFRATTAGGEGTTPFKSGVATTSMVDAAVVNGTTYYYTVAATNSVGSSAQSTEVNATPQDSITVPLAPTGLVATAGDAKVSLAWNASAGATSYNLYRSITAGGEGSTPVVTGITTTNYTNNGLTNDTTYYFTVVAVNSAGVSPQSVEANATPKSPVTIPPAPVGAVATASDAQVTVSWGASAGATSYNLYRSTTPGGEGTTPVATGITAASYTNTGLTNGVTYYFKVAAVNSAGVSAQSAEVNATPKVAVTIPPTPASVIANAGDAQVALSWSASAGAASYNLYRSTFPGGEGSTPVATGITTASYINTGLTNGLTYYYTVAAVNTAGVSAQSAEVNATPKSSITIPPTPAGVIATSGDAKAALSWSASASATSYNLYRSTTPGGEGSTPVVTGITTASYTSTGLTNGITYYFKVAAVNSAGVSAQSAEVSATPNSAITVPPTPTGVAAMAGDAQVALNWGASAGATSYNLYRGTTAGGEGSTPVAAGITSTGYTDTGLLNGATYFYKVAAVNAAGVSAQSAEVSATPASQGSGPATVKTSLANGSSGWWGENDLNLKNTAPITALTLTISVQKTPGLSYNGQYNTTGAFAQAHSETASTVVYTFKLNGGQTLNAGSWIFASQYGGTGTAHSLSGDTYVINYTSGGKAYTLTGRF